MSRTAKKLIIQETRSGGRHYIYRCPTIEGNQKLAQRPTTSEEEKKSDGKSQKVTLIETRGEGGCIVVAPTEGYELLNGSFDTIPTITPDERNVLLEAARELDVTKALIQTYGEPFYYNDKGNIKSLNESFWAGLYNAENNILYSHGEKQFYQYDEDRGIWKPVTDEMIIKQLDSRLLEESRNSGKAELENKRSLYILKNIITRLKGIAEQINSFERPNHYIHLKNEIIEIMKSGEPVGKIFSPAYYSRNQIEINFNPHAQCDRFRNQLLSALDKDDASLLQRWFGSAILQDNSALRTYLRLCLADNVRIQPAMPATLDRKGA